jgi:hypothetical protein
MMGLIALTLSGDSPAVIGRSFCPRWGAYRYYSITDMEQKESKRFIN